MTLDLLVMISSMVSNDDIRLISNDCFYGPPTKLFNEWQDWGIKTAGSYNVGKKLRTLQQRHLGCILKIKWSQLQMMKYYNVTEVIEIILIRSRLHWLGHVVRMPDERPPVIC